MGKQKHPRERFLYGVYEDGNLIFKGDVQQVADKFHTHRCNVYACANRGAKFDYRYVISHIGTYKPEEDTTRPRPLTEEEKKVKYYTEHLKRYGNTIVRWNDNPKKTIKWLKSIGFDCELKTYNHYIGDDVLFEGGRIGYAHLEQDHIVRWKDYDKQGIQGIV